MTFGTKKLMPWLLEQEEATEIVKKAYDQGINFFDTANAYCNGESERLLGKALKEINAKRERIVITTKVYLPCYDVVTTRPNFGNMDDPEMINRWGLSRKHIFDAVDASLERLGVDYIDLYLVHRFDPVSYYCFFRQTY